MQRLGSVGAANRAVLDRFARTGRYPRVVIVDPDAAAGAAGLERLAATDPLLAFVRSEYRVVEGMQGGPRPLVLVRD